MPANTITISGSIGWAQYFVGNRPLSLTASEPALTSANLVTQIMLQPPFRWRWNRATAGFFTIDPGGWKSVTTLSVGYRLLDSNSNMQIVTTAGITGSIVPVWNTVLGGTTADGTVVWTYSTGTQSDYIVPISDFGFIEKVYVVDQQGKTWEIPDIAQEMVQDRDTGRATAISPYLDDNQGNITFRFMPGLPDQQYNVQVIYQKQPTLLTSLSTAWQIPDRFGNVYQQGFLGFMYLFADNEKAGFMLQKFVASLLAVAEGLSEQERNIFIEQWYFTVEQARIGAKANQGISARSAL